MILVSLACLKSAKFLEPPTRPHTVHDAGLPTQQARATHPFAYDASQTLPFAALSGDKQPQRVAPRGPGEHLPTRESEVMSRGAGLGRPPTLGPAIGQGTNQDQTGSVGMGTFGLASGKQDSHFVSVVSAQVANILINRIKGSGHQTKVPLERHILMEILRTTLYHQVQSQSQ